jgi:Integrase core domain
MAHGFMYLVAILDVASRKVLSFRLSNTLTADFCVEALEEAMSKFGQPEIFNTDQAGVVQARVAKFIRTHKMRPSSSNIAAKTPSVGMGRPMAIQSSMNESLWLSVSSPPDAASVRSLAIRSLPPTAVGPIRDGRPVQEILPNSLWTNRVRREHESIASLAAKGVPIG